MSVSSPAANQTEADEALVERVFAEVAELENPLAWRRSIELFRAAGCGKAQALGLRGWLWELRRHRSIGKATARKERA